MKSQILGNERQNVYIWGRLCAITLCNNFVVLGTQKYAVNKQQSSL